MQRDVSKVQQSAAGRGWRRWLAAAILTAAIAMLVAGALLRHEPAFYAGADGAGQGTDDEARARRMMSKASAAVAALRRTDPWDAVITADEANAWLAIDLPRNHARLLPEGVTAPRVAFTPHHVRAGVRLGSGIAAAVVWIDAEVRLRGVNQVGLTIVDARIGYVPLPRGPIAHEFARRLHALGLVTDVRRGDRGPLLVVSAPATYDAAAGARLEMLAVTDGELLLAGGAAARSGVESK